jgi:hypothetical protein
MRKYSVRLKKLGDLRRYLAAQVTALDKGEIDENRLRCIAYALQILAGIIKDSDIEERLTALEQAAAERGNA